MKSICFLQLTCFLYYGLLFFPQAVSGQNPKGVIVANEKSASEGKTRALVIGISRYQFIDSLQFADKDAEVFAEYLRSSSFWNIDRDDITLLINDKAKYGDLTVQLQQIALQCKPGDNLLFYFSGHGDVETNTIFNRGFLLAQDTYSSNYMANGLRVDDLKDIFVTLLGNNVKVIVITDACRSGKLAGGMKGAEFTAAAIKNIWKNEIKILSSQPGQLSYEDRKWGNGRGVFSYYLISGLNGAADSNKDSSITLAELEMYVGSNVSRETDYRQQPIIEGPNKFSTVIARTGQRAAAGTKKAGNNRIIRLKEGLPPADSCDYYYAAMTKAIGDQKLVSPGVESAAYYYQQVKRCSPDKGFTLRANAVLLSALMNSSQEIVNNSFIGKSLVSYDQFKDAISMIGQIFSNNDLGLPNIQHWKNLQRYLYVLGETTWNDRDATDLLKKIIDTATAEEPEAAYLLTARATVEMKKKNWDTAISLLERSQEKSPGWLIPRYYLGMCYAKKRNYRKALEYYEQVLQKDTAYKTFECTKCILLNMAEYAFSTRQYKKGLDYLYRNIDLFPDHWAPYDVLYTYATEKKDSTVAREFLARLHRIDTTAETRLIRLRFWNEYSGKPIALDSLEMVRRELKDAGDSADYYYTLGLYYTHTTTYDPDSVQSCYTRAAELDTTESFYLFQLAEWLIRGEQYEEAEELLLRSISRFADDPKAEMQEILANIYLDTGRYDDAFTLYRELVASGYLLCTDLRKLKKAFKGMKEYVEYMKKCTDK